MPKTSSSPETRNAAFEAAINPADRRHVETGRLWGEMPQKPSDLFDALHGARESAKAHRDKPTVKAITELEHSFGMPFVHQARAFERSIVSDPGSSDQAKTNAREATKLTLEAMYVKANAVHTADIVAEGAKETRSLFEQQVEDEWDDVYGTDPAAKRAYKELANRVEELGDVVRSHEATPKTYAELAELRNKYTSPDATVQINSSLVSDLFDKVIVHPRPDRKEKARPDMMSLEQAEKVLGRTSEQVICKDGSTVRAIDTPGRVVDLSNTRGKEMTPFANPVRSTKTELIIAGERGGKPAQLSIVSGASHERFVVVTTVGDNDKVETRKIPLAPVIDISTGRRTFPQIDLGGTILIGAPKQFDSLSPLIAQHASFDKVTAIIAREKPAGAVRNRPEGAIDNPFVALRTTPQERATTPVAFRRSRRFGASTLSRLFRDRAA